LAAFRRVVYRLPEVPPLKKATVKQATRAKLSFSSLLFATACASSQPAATDDPCADVELDVERVWSASIKAEFLEHGGAIAGETREAVATKLDQVSRDWVMLRRSVCLDHFKRNVIDKDEYVSRTKCFDQTLEKQRALVSSFDSGSNTEGSSSVTALSHEIDQCGH
jgi:hypothetical protein